MAGERKGKAYEALVHVALQELVAAKKLRGPVHWNVTPKGMSIEPDFITGSNLNEPKTILLLNHSNAAGNSHMKFWRNLGELVEAKTTLQSVPRVYCLTLGIIKADLEPIQEHAFDRFVWVRQATHSWADEIDSFIASSVLSFPKGKDPQTDFMRSELKKAAPGVKAAYRQLKSLLEKMYKAKSVTLDKMWAAHRARPIPSVPAARNTYVRNGLSKLLLFPDPMDALASAATTRPLKKVNDIKILSDHHLIRRMGKVCNVADPEIASVAKLLSSTQVASIVGKYRMAGSRWFDQVTSVPELPEMLKYLKANHTRLINPKAMFGFIKSTHHADLSGIRCGFTWGYYRIMDAIKLSANMRQGYGLAQMLHDIKIARRSAGHVRQVATVAGIDERQVNLRGLRSIERLISVQLGDWKSPSSKDLFTRFAVDMAEVSIALAARVKLVRSSTFDDIDAFSESIFQCNIINGFATWRHYEPLRDLICLSLSGFSEPTLRVCFAEPSHGVIRQESGTMNLIQLGHTLINWQSAHGSHTNDKKKELCGRSIGLRYHWDGKAFVHRAGIEKMVLVLDGTWKQADLNALVRAGWDEIYYPDEMDELAKAIV